MSAEQDALRILVGWDDPAEIDLLGIYLGAGEDAAGSGEVRFCRNAEEAVAAAKSEDWDAVLLATTFPDDATGYDLFLSLHSLLPDVPFVGAVPISDVYKIARFLTKGLRGYLIRDAGGDFMFLARGVIEAAIKSIEAERERFIAEKLREEVEAVRKLQASITPNAMHCPDGYSVEARYESSQLKVIGGRPVTMAGGDYYDVFPLPDGKLALLVGDASGHGMKACMSIMTMHTLIRLLRENRFHDTAEFVSRVNRNLCQQSIVNDDGGFITLVYGVLDPTTHELVWTSAGHPVPLLHHRERGVVEPVAGPDAPGLPLGIYDEADYSVQRTVLPPHSRLILFTDGLIECFPVSEREHHEFGEAGLREALLQANDLPLPTTLQRLFDVTLEFTQGQGRHDDTSVVLLERH
jgi:serine phosphatase RsbU (regulator of sigma subunit)